MWASKLQDIPVEAESLQLCEENVRLREGTRPKQEKKFFTLVVGRQPTGRHDGKHARKMVLKVMVAHISQTVIGQQAEEESFAVRTSSSGWKSSFPRLGKAPALTKWVWRCVMRK